MIDVNRWVGYISISIVMIFGILFVSGMVGEFELSLRITVALIVLVYVLVRIGMLYLSRKKQLERRSHLRSRMSIIERKNGGESNSNNA